MASDLVGQARAAHGNRQWADARSLFEAAGGFDQLDPADAERLAWSITWCGSASNACLDAFERLEAACGDAGDARGTARAALEQARVHGLVGREVVAAACWMRAMEAVADDEGAPEHGLAWALAAYAQLLAGDLGAVQQLAGRALEIGRRTQDRTVEAFALYQLGQAQMLGGEVEAGLAAIDRAVSMALSGAVAPWQAATIFCGVLWACRQIGDWRRAAQWHDVGSRWCTRHALAHFPVHLEVHRAELARVQGRLEESEKIGRAAVAMAGDWSPAFTGWAYHQLGETLLCRGDLEGAARTFTEAEKHGADPQPGLARLLLHRGRKQEALERVARVIEDPGWVALSSLVTTLPVAVTAACACGELATATHWRDQLDKLAERYGTPGPRAAAQAASAELALARHDTAGAVEWLRLAAETWEGAGARYDAACARVLLAAAYRRDGQAACADGELRTAAAQFAAMGAAEELARAERMLEAAGDDPAREDRLTPRQREVAALIARGFSNQQIAEHLVISRFTAETHVRNILTQLGASSRASIAAWATTHA